MSKNYDDPVYQSNTIAGASLIGGAAVIGRIAGPAGKTGRVVSINGVVTTGITVADATIDINSAGEATAVVGTLPIAAANAAVSATKAEILAGTELLADTVVEVNTGGEATAGAADVTIVTAWY